MHCITAPGAFICSFRAPEPSECHELIWSQGRACRKCWYRKCDYAGLPKSDVDQKERARWKEKHQKLRVTSTK